MLIDGGNVINAGRDIFDIEGGSLLRIGGTASPADKLSCYWASSKLAYGGLTRSCERERAKK